MELFIIKRDGTKEAFSIEKIRNAITKAFLSVGSFATQEVISNILCRVKIFDGISVEEVQNQVEMMDYCNASNAATGSKFDANANVENKNITTLIGELPKSNFIRLNRRMLTDIRFLPI